MQKKITISDEFNDQLMALEKATGISAASFIAWSAYEKLNSLNMQSNQPFKSSLQSANSTVQAKQSEPELCTLPICRFNFTKDGIAPTPHNISSKCRDIDGDPIYDPKLLI